MNVKLLEVRDEGTFIPMLCVDMNPSSDVDFGRQGAEYHAQRYLLRRCGYPCDGRPNIAITPLRADGDKCSNDPHYWGDRTYAAAHLYITENWVKLKDGDVVDVSFILGETKEPKISERLSAPL